MGGFLFVQVDADGDGGIGIDGAVASLDVANDTVLINDQVGAERPLVAFTLHIVGFQYAVSGEHLMVHIAQQRKLDPNLLGESRVGRGTVHAHTENFRVVRVKLARVDSRLDRLELFGSTTGKREDIDGKEDILFAMEVAELHGLPLVTE